jgi:hypothetical protein
LAEGVAAHRLSGPNPPTVAERLTRPALANQPRGPVSAAAGGAHAARLTSRLHGRPPVDSELPVAPPPVVVPATTTRPSEQ